MRPDTTKKRVPIGTWLYRKVATGAHEDGHQGIKGGADGVPPLLCSHGDETGIPGVKGQPVEHGDGTHHQGEPHIQAIGKGVACDPDPHGGVDGGQQDVQSHDHFFLPPLSMRGATRMGRIISGSMPHTRMRADSRVDCVWSNTRRLMGRFMASPPMADRTVATVMQEKSLVQSRGRMGLCFTGSSSVLFLRIFYHFT